MRTQWLHRVIPLLLICIAVSTSVWAEDTESSPSPDIPVRAIAEFVSVFERVRTEHVDNHTDESLFKLAMEGLMLKLDPYSEYLDAKANQSIAEVTSGQFVGIGIDIEPTGHSVTVIAPIDNSPAATAGILAGDRIIKIDGVPLKGKNRSQISRLLTGPEGSKIELIIYRQGKELTYNLTRALVEAPSVRGKIMADSDIGYIRIGVFQKDTHQELEATFAELLDQGATAWLLDLRNNPGGLLESGANVANGFLSSGTIVTTRGKLHHHNKDFRATAANPSQGLPTLVLINHGSASSAEIVAAALQENNRAQIAGHASFGKGSVQSIIAIDDMRSIRLTTAYHYTPLGNNVNETGVKPDQLIDDNLTFDETLMAAKALLQAQLSNP